MAVHPSIVPQLSKNALTVLEKRYLRKDQNGLVIEKAADMFRRVADAIAHADRKFRDDADTSALADRFYQCHGRSRVPSEFSHAHECRP